MGGLWGGGKGEPGPATVQGRGRLASPRTSRPRSGRRTSAPRPVHGGNIVFLKARCRRVPTLCFKRMWFRGVGCGMLWSMHGKFKNSRHVKIPRYPGLASHPSHEGEVQLIKKVYRAAFAIYWQNPRFPRGDDPDLVRGCPPRSTVYGASPVPPLVNYVFSLEAERRQRAYQYQRGNSACFCSASMFFWGGGL